MKTNIGKRLLSGLLSLIMVFSLVPAMDLTLEAEAAPTGNNYITMPITIRDYAADGMLFEFNQVGATGTTGNGGVAPNAVYSTHTGLGAGEMSAQSGYNRYTGTNNAGMYITYAVSGQTRESMRYIVFKYRTNSAASSGNTPQISVRTGGGGIHNYVNLPTTGYNKASTWTTVVIDTGATSTDAVSYVTVYPRLPSGKYIEIAYIAFFDDKDAAETYKENDGVVVNSAVYNQGDTAGFSLLSTGAADYINNLPADESTTIAGTDLIQNGTWGLQSDPDPVTTTLNSGAKQQVYGAWIRTDLVQPKLVNGKMVYTEATVKYLAEYMQQIMAVPEKNSDGSYNTYFVKGHKLSELGGSDLAAKIRAQVTGGPGDYATAKSKYDAGNLSSYTGIATWYDAAYFLLHNTFSDSTGYGKTVDNYKNLHLVQTTNDDGETCYVFNSKYDDTKYDYSNGEIYNTQTSSFTIAKTNSGTETYVRGNPLPEPRFDPLGPSGTGGNYGYGMSGDIYGDMISDSTADWAAFYDETNYHLSLEGHAQFIYYEDDDLYFTFTGDDDVYLFINGVRVLDVGAAHSISKAKITLNDVAGLCGLKDGQAYDFDFFYMERHGTAANFGIETNIKIVDPSMTTTKTGYQNGASTGYNGFVDPNKPVAYSFELQNNGEADLQNLIFDDGDIDVYFGYDNVRLNADSNINEMYLYRYNSDGTVKSSYAAGSLTGAILKAELTEGLPVGEKIGIYGFKYNIPSDAWVDDTFPNTVYTRATSIGDNNSTKTLNGIADWKVQKSDLITEPFHVYDWVAKDVSKDPAVVCDWTSPDGASVTVTKEELIQPVKDANHTVPNDVTIMLCSASGSESGVNVNPNAELNSDGSITYTSTKPGLDTVYYKIKGMNYDTMVFRYDVYTYGTVNNVYVLDYGLAVELNGEDFGLAVNDYLTLPQNTYGTTATVTGVQDGTSNYGDFTWEDPSLKYTPDAIINDTDSVRANVQVLENGATELTKFTGVNMYETITTAPASVVYYEENFPGITYINEGENKWAHYETVDDEGNSVAGTEQSADQDSNYGSDPNYEEDKVGTIVSGDSVGTVVDKWSFQLDTTNLDTLQSSGIDALNQYLGLGGSDSNGTVNELEVKQTAEVMFFEFQGTGFEIVSRTTDEQYAVINVQVQKKNADGTYTVVKQKPVITESKGGDLYQVPIISITGLEKAEYRVVVKAAGSTDTVTRVLYIDGIRIYGPLDDGSALEYYNPEEYQAEIFEIKQLIENGQMIYADASETDDELQLVTGTTLIENVELDSVLTSIESVEEYMTVGPNNELYLDGNAATGMIAFFLTPDANTPIAARTLEIGAHRKSDSFYEDNGDVYMTYAGTAEEIIEGTNIYEIGSGTEMYYSIDVNKLVLDENGRYLVMIGTNGSEDYGTTLALTNLKVSGYTVHFAETAVVDAYTAGELNEISIIAEPVQVYKARLAAAKPEASEPEVTEPEVTEPEVTEPEVTEPEVTEPEVTEPEMTEPKETESEKTEPEVTEPVATEPEVTEPVVTEPEITLTINSAALKADKVVSGKVANMTVKASAEAASIVVTDADGNVMEPERCTVKASGDIVAFNFIWKVTGSRGDALDFTIRAYDADGRPSLNEETVTVTIK